MSMMPPAGPADATNRSDFEPLSDEMALGSQALRAEIRAVEARLRAEIRRSIRSQTWALMAWTAWLTVLVISLGS